MEGKNRGDLMVIFVYFRTILTLYYHYSNSFVTIATVYISDFALPA